MTVAEEYSKYEQLVRDVQGTFGTAEGKRVLAWLKLLCGHGFPQTPARTDVPIDPYRLAVNVGRHDIFTEIKRHIDKDLSEKPTADAINVKD